MVTKSDGTYGLSLVDIKIYKKEDFVSELKDMEEELTERKKLFNRRIKSTVYGVLDSLNNDYHELEMASIKAEPHSFQEERTLKSLKRMKRYRMEEVLGEIIILRDKYHTIQVRSIVERLSKPHRSAKTDEDGDFLISLETGSSYIFCATSRRKVASKTEFYAWTHEVKISNNKMNKIILSNDNLAGMGRGAVDWEKYELLSSDVPSIQGTAVEDITRSMIE